MPYNEQTAWHHPHTLRAHRPPSEADPPLRGRHGAGHQAGLHPEDQPHLTTQTQPQRRIPQADLATYEYPRMPTVVRKYNQPSTQVTEEIAARRLLPAHFLLTSLGIILLAITFAIFLMVYALPAFARWNDDRTYGYPRTTHARAIVGHGNAQHPYSDFTGENINGDIYVLEIEETDPSRAVAHVYFVVRISGKQSELVAVQSITFADVNGDGKVDMLVTVENGSTFIFYNIGSEFSQTDPTKKQ